MALSRLLGLCGLVVACGDFDAQRTELFRIERPAVASTGELAVNQDGGYLYWFRGDASKREQRGELSADQLTSARRATTPEVRRALMACAASDFDECSAGVDGYVMTTLSGTACWLATEVEKSCGVANHFVVLVGLLHSVAGETDH